jgi:chromosome segregation protein
LYLKSLEIQGFKSFADRIVLHFNKGLTTVVGPNGSGKSNIADAVRWVLGEQSPKTLRGSKMEDVIFSGTQYRKPVGFAYVSMTIDNSDHVLPVEYNEVTVSRRMYRSGESEYYLNKTQCRLKDITELFMNTGVGREGYSIIGQGRIDEILSTKSDERRLVFEEAAGITKFKTRRKEAERKLENTRQNLVRIQDILNELESQLEPLAEQAQTARRYIELSNELKVIEVNVFLETIDKLKNRMSQAESQADTIREQIDEENRRIENIRNNNRVKNENLDKLKKELEELRGNINLLDTKIEKKESRINLYEEKINHLTSNNDSFSQDIASMRERVIRLDEDIAKKQNRLSQLERDEKRFSKILSEAEEKLAAIIAKLDQNERLIEEAKQAIMDKLDVLSDIKVRQNNLKNDAENYRQLKERLKEEIRQSVLEKDRDSMKKEDLESSLREIRQNIVSSKNTLDELSWQKTDLQKKLQSLKSQQDNKRREVQSLESRHRILSDMQQRMEGYSNSVKAVLSFNGKGRLEGIYGALAQLISVEKRYETAIEVSLGGALQNIITQDEFSARNAIEYLKNNNLGRVTFLPLTSIKARTIEASVLSEAQSMKGFLGAASEKVSCDSKFANIVLNLLGRTVIVEDMDSGIMMARKFNFAFRIVTLDGQLINPGGSMTGGSIASKSSSLLSRNRMINELYEALEKARQELGRLDEAVLIEEQALKDIDIALEEQQKDLSSLELVRLRDENQLAGILENIKKLEARIDMQKQQDKEINRQLEQIKTEIESENKKAGAVEEEINNLRQKVSSHQIQNKDEQLKRDELHTDINDYKVSVNSIAESKQNIKQQIMDLINEKNNMVSSLAKRESEKEQNVIKISSLRDEIEGLRKNISALKEERTGKELKKEGLTDEIKVLEEELSGMLDRVTEHNETIHSLQEELGRLEARKAKMESELETVQNRLWDDYSLTYGNAVELRSGIKNLKLTQSRVNELKAEIRNLGPVNVSAIEDYAKTRERYSFMKKQHDDLILAGQKLERVIQEITRVMKKQFKEQFELINIHFGQVFKELFDGGFAQVKIADEDNILESDIDIIVQPPGKKLQNMMLLSGGERAMVAIALIFGILKMRPAPFYILDEIDASLDDANVLRFAEYIRSFAHEFQFITITHRKATMGVADTMYGVTMQEQGISKIVSLRMEGSMKKASAG